MDSRTFFHIYPARASAEGVAVAGIPVLCGGMRENMLPTLSSTNSSSGTTGLSVLLDIEVSIISSSIALVRSKRASGEVLIGSKSPTCLNRGVS